jgi:hypothetical protein
MFQPPGSGEGRLSRLNLLLSLLQILPQEFLNGEDSFMKRVSCFCLLLCGVALLWSSPAWAGPGKIAGKVVDDAGEAVIGASVQIMETQQGAAVGIDGNYVILGVQPGKSWK